MLSVHENYLHAHSACAYNFKRTLSVHLQFFFTKKLGNFKLPKKICLFQRFGGEEGRQREHPSATDHQRR
jgi:hypothetical protein